MQVSILPLAMILAGCAAVTVEPGDPAAPSQLTPKEAVGIAEELTHHKWTPFARNILHGADADGVSVETPDIGYQPVDNHGGWWVPGRVNEGIPYKWGGFDGVEAFDRAIASGAPAGDVHTPAKRKSDRAAVSARAVGVDCSGFVSLCLKLPEIHDTRELPALCDRIRYPAEVRAGDIMVKPGRHALFVAGRSEKKPGWIYYYETGGIPEWKPGLKLSPLSKLLALGLEPLRYRGMAREPISEAKDILTRAMLSRVVVVPEPVLATP